MKAVLSLLFLSILIFCVWSGYKKGLVMGIFSLIAFVVSVYGANLLSPDLFRRGDRRAAPVRQRLC